MTTAKSAPALALLFGVGAALVPGAAAQDGFVKTLAIHVGKDFRAQGEPGSLLILSLAGAGALAAGPNDGQVRTSVLSTPLMSRDAANAASTLGQGYILAPALGCAFLGGWLAYDAPAADFGEQGLEALAVSGLETQMLKLTVRRERPDGSDPYSFPSGHSTAAFSVATVAAETWGWKGGVPAFLVAAFIGYSRLQLDKHYLSDVLFGAGVGISAGRAVALSHRARADSWALAPVLLPGGIGLTLAF